MLEEIYNIDENLTEDDYCDALLYILGDVYPYLSVNEIEEILEDRLNQMPVQDAESILKTIKSVGNTIGSGILQFSADNPDLIKTATMVTGSAIGGPIGGQIGGKVSNYLTKTTQPNSLPQTAKALSVIQNPQAQSAIARTSLGVGNGTAPLSINGNINLIPVATYLRAIITASQEALRELDKYNIVPDPTFSESMPFFQDLDMQAEWLAEKLYQEG